MATATGGEADMDIVYAGTPRFAEVALQALLDAGHRVKLVLTQPDRAAGRGREIRPSPVKRLAQRYRLDVLQPASLRDDAVAAIVAKAAAEVMVVAAYGLLIPKSMLAVPPRGCINIHASLLPRWRGAAPIQRALIAGDAITGISIMQMDEGLDTGPILRQEAIAIAPNDTAGTLHDRLAALGGRLVVEALKAPQPPAPQSDTGVTYAAKIDKREARIDWTQSADAIERRLRAFDPDPGAHTRYDGGMLKIWRAEVLLGVTAPPGRVIDADANGVVAACGRDALRITEMQRAGGKRVPARAFLAGHPMPRGTQFD